MNNLFAIWIISIFVLAGCGGGSDSGANNGGNTPPANNAPTANAGSDQTVSEKTTVTLTGSGADSDGSIASYSWTQTAGTGVTLSDASNATTTFTAPDINADETLTFQLTVMDNDGATKMDTLDVLIKHVNSIPSVNAGTAQRVSANSVVTLSGSANDQDGNIVNYSWLQIEGVSVVLSDSSSATTTFTAPQIEVEMALTFELTVIDNEGVSATDSVTVTVVPVPTEVTGEFLTNSENYQVIGFSDANGVVDVSELLKDLGYISSDDQDSYQFTIVDNLASALPNIEVSYLHESEQHQLHLRVNDPYDDLSTIYQTVDIESLLNSDLQAKASSERAATPLVRIILQFILRSLRAIEFVDSVLTIHDLFNLDLSFHRYQDEVYLEGTVSEFYSLYAGVSSLRLPIVMARDVRRYSNKVTAPRAFKPKRGEERSQLLSYLQTVGGYILANDDTLIRIKLNLINDRGRFFSLEVIGGSNNGEPSGDFYDISIDIAGQSGHPFDVGTDPDFYGWVVIKGAAFEFKMPANELRAGDVIKNVPLEIGDDISVSVLDEDVFFDDQIAKFQFIFDGSNYTTSDDSVSVALSFDKKVIIPPGGEENLYSVDVTIVGDENHWFDVFGNAPDFRGSIIFDDFTVELEVTDDSYRATYHFQNISLALGDQIAIYLEDEDPISDDELLDVSFVFDGANHIENAEHVRVFFEFEQE